MAYQSLYLSFFLSFQQFFPSYQLSICGCYSLQILYTQWGQPNALLKTKPRCRDSFLPSFSIFSFFNLSLPGNKYGNFRQRFLRNLLDLGFWNLVQTSGMTGCTVYRRISHIWLISPFICPFFFISNKIFCYSFLSFYLSQSL